MPWRTRRATVVNAALVTMAADDALGLVRRMMNHRSLHVMRDVLSIHMIWNTSALLLLCVTNEPLCVTNEPEVKESQTWKSYTVPVEEYVCVGRHQTKHNNQRHQYWCTIFEYRWLIFVLDRRVIGSRIHPESTKVRWYYRYRVMWGFHAEPTRTDWSRCRLVEATRTMLLDWKRYNRLLEWKLTTIR